jgi:hypothetical protein
MTNDLVETAPGPSDAQLKRIITTAREQYRLEMQIAKAEQALEEKKAKLRELQEKTLPDLMLEAGSDLIGLGNGAVLELVTQYNARWPKEPNAREKAIAVLEKHKAGDIIKRELTVGFGKGQVKPMAMVVNYLRKRKFANSLIIEQDITVHSQTLSAWVREKLDAGFEVPMDILGVHQRRYTRIKVKAKKKKGDL